MEEIEIALGNLDESDDRVDRTEPGADGKVAGVLLFESDVEVATVGNVRLLIARFHFTLEVLQTVQPALADLDADGVVDLARRHGQFAADDLVLGLGVALDLDLFDQDLLGFADDILDVDRACLDVGPLDRGDRGVDVASRTVGVLDRFDRLGKSFGGEGVSGHHLRPLLLLVQILD